MRIILLTVFYKHLELCSSGLPLFILCSDYQAVTGLQEDLRNNMIAVVKESTALKRPGAQNMKTRQLSDAIFEEVGLVKRGFHLSSSTLVVVNWL